MRAAILPSPRTDGPLSLERTLGRRRSVREFAPAALAAADIGQILWAAQGVTGGDGGRTAPSAGALYPLEVYAVTASGVARYDARAHGLLRLQDADVRAALRAAALDQECVGEAPLTVVLAAVVARTAGKYGRTRAPRYVHLEAGHAAQNILLQAVALGLGAVPVGAFDDEDVQAVLHLPADHEPLYLICVGHPRRTSGSP
jgi:SagB-type dehydrogenase family enzyme